MRTREIQGAFAFFELQNKYITERKHVNHYINTPDEWYRVRGNYDTYQEYFNTYFFTPFIELLEWYFGESKIKNESDYFSREEFILVEERLEDVKNQLILLGLGQELIFSEIDEMKTLGKGLNKKNWSEVIRGKLTDSALGNVVTVENATKLLKGLFEGIGNLG